MNKAKPIRWTIEQAAIEFSRDRRTISKRLRQAEIEPAKDGKYSTAQIIAAVFGDEDHERLRKLTEEADKLAIANAKSRGELCETEAVFRTFQGIFISIRQTVLASGLSNDEKDELLLNMKGLTYEHAKRAGIASSSDDAGGRSDSASED